jgi:type IV pilus assembly protein PilB
MVRQQKKRIGELLLEDGAISAEQLAQAIARQKRTGERLGQALMALGIPEERITQALARQLSLSIVNLQKQKIDPGVAALLPEALARKHSVLPIRKEGHHIVVVMADPLDVVATDDVSLATGLTVTPVIATPAEIKEAIERAYGLGEQVRDIIDEMPDPTAGPEDAAAGGDRPDAPIVRLADLILARAIQDRASDIHIEPMEAEARVRYRIDGVLHTAMTVPPQAYAPLVARFKVMARMNVAERRIPQDGSFEMVADGRTVDFRVATIPLARGERVALRLLDKAQAIMTLPQLGMEDVTLQRFERLIHLPYGIVLVSGPTGSGKTTTLVSGIAMLNSLDRNIITVEDPIEYQIPGVSQMAVNPRAGLTFATALRAMVRQDPDIIMVGEIRDVETAEISIHASLTGHLVFSTIHTNDAPSVITRLLDMGIEPFLIASSLAGALAQRLVRVLCSKCKRPAPPPPELAEMLQQAGGGAVPQIYEPAGCAHCKYTGYLGRSGIFELLVMSEQIRQHVIGRSSATTLAAAARVEGMHTMRESGFRQIARGITTVEEVLRVTRVMDVE